jgi:hypothetical protein
MDFATKLLLGFGCAVLLGSALCVGWIAVTTLAGVL